MKTRYVGVLLLGIALLIFLIIISYNNALEEIVTASCTHGVACPMHQTVQTQKIVSYSLMSILILVGSVLTIFVKDPTTEKARKKVKNAVSLTEEETQAMQVIDVHEGSVYQSDFIKELGLSKVKASRLLDKLEGKGLIERHRRGMTNIIRK